MIGSRARGRFDFASPPQKWKGEHDLTDPRSLVCIAGELREREAARQGAKRRAWEARQRRSWLFRLVSRVRDWRARRDRPRTGLPARTCPGCGCGLPVGPAVVCLACAEEGDQERAIIREMAAERVTATLSAGSLLTLARAAALRDAEHKLAEGIHTVILLDITGNLDDMAPLVASVRAAFKEALGPLDSEPVH